MKHCTDCINWIPESTWADCQGKSVSAFPAHCQVVIDPDSWNASECRQYDKSLLPRRNDETQKSSSKA